MNVYTHKITLLLIIETSLIVIKGCILNEMFVFAHLIQIQNILSFVPGVGDHVDALMVENAQLRDTQ